MNGHSERIISEALMHHQAIESLETRIPPVHIQTMAVLRALNAAQFRGEISTADYAARNTLSTYRQLLAKLLDSHDTM